MRILKPERLFITQQVGNKNASSLIQFLTGNDIKSSNWNLRSAVEELQSVGFKNTPATGRFTVLSVL